MLVRKMRLSLTRLLPLRGESALISGSESLNTGRPWAVGRTERSSSGSSLPPEFRHVAAFPSCRNVSLEFAPKYPLGNPWAARESPSAASSRASQPSKSGVLRALASRDKAVSRAWTDEFGVAKAYGSYRGFARRPRDRRSLHPASKRAASGLGHGRRRCRQAHPLREAAGAEVPARQARWSTPAASAA